jgi:hypothetical protein
VADQYDSSEDSASGAPEESAAHARILETARARFKIADEATGDNRRQALEDMKFAAGDQWEPAIVAQRERDRRPVLTINRLPGYIQQITNDQRQNRPSIKVHPVDDEADVETAKIIQGLIRHIEKNSNADAAYDTAFEGAVRGGFGFFRLITAYCDPLSFDQEILVKRIPNPLSVLLDPHHQEPDASDMNWGFIIEPYAEEEYKAQFPDSKLAADGAWKLEGAESPDWFADNTTIVAEYFFKDHVDATLLQLQMDDGSVVALTTKDLESQGVSLAGLALKKGVEITLKNGQKAAILQTRKTRIPVVKWCKLNACEVLDETELPGQYIPIIPVYGTELNIEGKRILEGIVRNAKDAQRQLNYWKTAETELIALAPRAPWIAEERQLKGYEAMWETSNTRNHAFLKYKAVLENGTPLPPPQRVFGEPAVQAVTQAGIMAGEDMKSVIGIHNPTMGAPSNETSGKAILARNAQAQTTNFHYVDNLTRALKHAGRIIVQWLPVIYDIARTARIIGEDGEQKVVQLNQPILENGQPKLSKEGKPLIYDLTVGKYDVTVEVGPSYASRRQEAVEAMLEFVRVYPAAAGIIGDLLAKNMDWPGAQEIADRLRKTIAPHLLEDGQNPTQIPPQAQAQIEQMGKMVEELTGKLQELQNERDWKLIEVESRERMHAAELETKAVIKLAELQSNEDLSELKLRVQGASARLQLQRQVHDLQARQETLRSDEPIVPTAGAAAPLEEDPESFAPPPADRDPMGAEIGAEESIPTGGESPGQPLGEIHDDPNAF